MGGFGRALVEKTRESALDEGRKEGIKEGAKGEHDNILNNIINNLMKANGMLTREQATEQAKALMA